MAIQTRKLLDMLLAKENGVCSMFGDLCCPYIPKNSAPDASMIKFKEASGINNPIEDCFHNMFGR